MLRRLNEYKGMKPRKSKETEIYYHFFQSIPANTNFFVKSILFITQMCKMSEDPDDFSKEEIDVSSELKTNKKHTNDKSSNPELNVVPDQIQAFEVWVYHNQYDGTQITVSSNFIDGDGNVQESKGYDAGDIQTTGDDHTAGSRTCQSNSFKDDQCLGVVGGL